MIARGTWCMASITIFAENSLDRKGTRAGTWIDCAAQPSHDKAKEIPLVDFDVNAGATVNLLEATRLANPDAVFIFMSTNKVYGDAPNEFPMRELPTRWDYAR